MKTSAFARWIGAVALTAATALPAAAQSALAAPAFSGLYVFGDSLSDSGNNNVQFGGLAGGPPPTAVFVPTLPYLPSAGFTNRPTYSNGPVWVSSFASSLGLSAFAQPSLLGGGDYAYGGARMTTDGSGGTGLPPNFPASVQTQLNTYLGSRVVSSTALYVIAGGGNDVRDVGASLNGTPAHDTPIIVSAATAYATAAAQMVGALKIGGAQNLVVWNVPDVGKSPAAGSGVGPTAAGASAVASTFNSFLAGALAGSGATIFDTYGLINNIVASPAAYGFSNVTLGCGFAGNNCNAATALFWDGIHPTAYAQGLIANAMLAAVTAVPEPASALLMVIGAAGLLLVRQRRMTAVA